MCIYRLGVPVPPTYLTCSQDATASWMIWIQRKRAGCGPLSMHYPMPPISFSTVFLRKLYFSQEQAKHHWKTLKATAALRLIRFHSKARRWVIYQVITPQKQCAQGEGSMLSAMTVSQRIRAIIFEQNEYPIAP